MASTSGVRIVLASWAVASAIAASGAVAMGRQASSDPVFTAEQAAAGKKAFDRACASCHMTDLSGNEDAPPLAGTLFLDTWRARTTKDLFDYIVGAMPPGGPSQNEDTYRSIVAFILESNGAVPGTRPFEASTVAPIADVTRR